jgi:DNA-binding NarL/FixJ family response regulator
VTREKKKSTIGTRGEAEIHMVRDITISTRELTPFEQLVLELVCEGKSSAQVLELNLMEKQIFVFC